MSENLDYKGLWEEAMTKIKSEIGEQVFDRWLNLDFVSSSQDKIIVSAPSSLHIDQINVRFPKLIESKLRELSGKNIDIVIKVGKNSNQNITKTEELQIKQIKTEGIKSPVTKPPKNTVELQMREEFTFENYVTGENNDFAVNAALAVSRNPGTVISYNPLFIYGGVGLGKTHLIQAIGNYTQNNSENKVIYITAEAFTNEFIESIKQNMPAFKKKYRFADLLLIDDIHFLENKPQCQEELFNTFNALVSKKRQMVFTCDRPISKLRHISERLTSRLGSGLQVDIQIPQYETRCAILSKKIETFNVQIPDSVIELICRNISSNVRDMVAALNKLAGFAELTRKSITLESAKNQLKDIFTSPKQSNVSIDNIIQVISSHFDISISDIKSKKKTKNIVYPRQLAMYIARNITEMSTTEIGESFGGRDHSTVIHATEKIEEFKHSDPTEDGRIQNLIKLIKEYSVK
jgi:chromosomal replication initiator protein